MAALHLLADLVPRHRAIVVVVEAAEDAAVVLAELLRRDPAVAVVVMSLEAIDHALAHRVQPERLILLERQAAVAVAVELGEFRPPCLVDLGLGEPVVVIGVEGLEQPFGAPVMAGAVMAAPAAAGQAHAGKGGDADGERAGGQQKLGRPRHLQTSLRCRCDDRQGSK